VFPVLVLHGPSLNILGFRDPKIYGSLALPEIDEHLIDLGQELGLAVQAFQSNSEGVLIDHLHAARVWAKGVVFNPASYTHSSIALRDAVDAIKLPVIEVHLSNLCAREEFRHRSLIAPVCVGTIMGFGWWSYALALHAMADILKTPSNS